MENVTKLEFVLRQQLGNSAGQKGRGEGACNSLAGDSDSDEALKWNNAAPTALQSVLSCSDLPCCLCCHRHLYPASFQHCSLHLPGKILLTSPPRQGEPECCKSPSLVEGMSAA